MLRLALPFLLLLAACDSNTPPLLQGYAEGEYLYLSARDTGEILSLNAREGDEIAAGATLIVLDDLRQKAAAARAEDALAEARAAAILAVQTYNRTKTLKAQRHVAQAQLDEAAASLDAANARLREAEANLAIAQQDLKDRILSAPQAGRVEAVYRRAGERAGPNEPILSVLPPANIKIRFFVPQAQLSKLKPGDEVQVTCDACKEAIAAHITFIASEPQFTPPFIYSESERNKLVFLVEARPTDAKGLRPGQPLDVRLPQ